jgi:hypothetical protein
LYRECESCDTIGPPYFSALTASPAPQERKTPLQLAVQEGKDEVAKILREAGAFDYGYWE